MQIYSYNKHALLYTYIAFPAIYNSLFVFCKRVTTSRSYVGLQMVVLVCSGESVGSVCSYSILQLQRLVSVVTCSYHIRARLPDADWVAKLVAPANSIKAAYCGCIVSITRVSGVYVCRGPERPKHDYAVINIQLQLQGTAYRPVVTRAPQRRTLFCYLILYCLYIIIIIIIIIAELQLYKLKSEGVVCVNVIVLSRAYIHIIDIYTMN